MPSPKLRFPLTALLASSAEALVFQSTHKSNTSSLNSLPVDPTKFSSDVFDACHGGRKLSKWTSHEPIEKMVNNWQAKLPDGGIILDDGESACLADGSSKGGKVLSIVEKTEPLLCQVHPNGAGFHSFAEKAFDVDSKVMEKFGDSRNYLTIWPKEGTCTKEAPCPVVLFFHGCGGYLPYLQFAKYDSNCFDELKSILVFPRLMNGKHQGDETWTGDGTEVMQKFVMPFWNQFTAENADVIDLDRVIVMGESLGTGMALQVGLSYPDIFSAIIATGLTSGDSCGDVDDFQIGTVLPVTSGRTASKLKTVVATFGERERKSNERVERLLQLLENAGVYDKVSVHFRIFTNMGHLDSILKTQNNWKGMYDAVWKGNLP